MPFTALVFSLCPNPSPPFRFYYTRKLDFHEKQGSPIEGRPVGGLEESGLCCGLRFLFQNLRRREEQRQAAQSRIASAAAFVLIRPGIGLRRRFGARGRLRFGVGRRSRGPDRREAPQVVFKKS